VAARLPSCAPWLSHGKVEGSDSEMFFEMLAQDFGVPFQGVGFYLRPHRGRCPRLLWSSPSGCRWRSKFGIPSYILEKTSIRRRSADEARPKKRKQAYGRGVYPFRFNNHGVSITLWALAQGPVTLRDVESHFKQGMASSCRCCLGKRRRSGVGCRFSLAAPPIRAYPRIMDDD
jgi:hypothetical protein